MLFTPCSSRTLLSPPPPQELSAGPGHSCNGGAARNSHQRLADEGAADADGSADAERYEPMTLRSAAVYHDYLRAHASDAAREEAERYAEYEGRAAPRAVQRRQRRLLSKVEHERLRGAAVLLPFP